MSAHNPGQIAYEAAAKESGCDQPWSEANQLKWNKAANAVLANFVCTRFQARVWSWALECFGEVVAKCRDERNHRFVEEALELAQSLGCTASEAHQLVDYVWGRPAGDPAQEVGGVMVTLAVLCQAHGLDMHAAGEDELARIWTKVEQIRAKQAAKPKYTPLPGPGEAPPDRSIP